MYYTDREEEILNYGCLQLELTQLIILAVSLIHSFWDVKARKATVITSFDFLHNPGQRNKPNRLHQTYFITHVSIHAD